MLLTKQRAIAQPCFEIQLILIIWRCHLIHCVGLTVRAQREAQHSWWHLPQAVGMSPGRWLWFWAIVTVPGLGTSRIYALCACTQLSEAFLESLAQGTSGLRASFSREVLRPQGTLQNRRLTSEGKQPLLPSLLQTVEQQNSLLLFFRFLISFFASYIGGSTRYGARQED